MHIFYLDNLESRSAIYHFITLRARFFSKSVMERIIREDKRRDRDGGSLRTGIYGYLTFFIQCSDLFLHMPLNPMLSHFSTHLLLNARTVVL
jgi:hypothetical protein